MTTRRLMLAVFTMLIAAAEPPAFGDSLPVRADASVNLSAPGQRLGASAHVLVQNVGVGGRRGFVQFDLGALPAGTAVERATLRAFVAAAQVPGPVNVAVVSGAWNESTVSAATAPSTQPPMATLTVAAGDVNRYVSVDVTAVVQAWLNGLYPNHGLALLPGTARVRVMFDSKENAQTSHPMELEVIPSAGTAGPPGPPGPAGPPGPPGPPGPDQSQAIANLQSQVSQLTDRVVRLERTFYIASVNCAAGESINDAIGDAPPHVRSISLSVSGLCHDRVTISHDHVVISGVTPDAGIAAPSGAAVFVAGASNVSLNDLALSGPGGALNLLHSQAVGRNLHTDGGVGLARGSTLELFNSHVSGAAQPAVQGGNGIYVGGNSYLAIFNSTVSGNLFYGIHAAGSVVELSNTALTGNGAGGLLVEGGSSADLQQFTSTDNTGPGVELRDASSARLYVSSLVARNDVGLQVGEGSHVHLGVTVVESNRGSGIVLADASSADAIRRTVPGDVPGNLQVRANAGWGVLCAPSPQVPQITGAFDGTTVFGNALGQISCPGF